LPPEVHAMMLRQETIPAPAGPVRCAQAEIDWMGINMRRVEPEMRRKKAELGGKSPFPLKAGTTNGI
jgi:hypothetical protein